MFLLLSRLCMCCSTNGVCFLSRADSAILHFRVNEAFRSAAYLTEWLLHPREGGDVSDPFKYAYRTDDGLYAWLERPENSLRLQQVGRSMSAAGAVEGNTSVADPSGTRPMLYPFCIHRGAVFFA